MCLCLYDRDDIHRLRGLNVSGSGIDSLREQHFWCGFLSIVEVVLVCSRGERQLPESKRWSVVPRGLVTGRVLGLSARLSRNSR